MLKIVRSLRGGKEERMLKIVRSLRGGKAPRVSTEGEKKVRLSVRNLSSQDSNQPLLGHAFIVMDIPFGQQ
jgi:hypothetical protein